MKAVIVEGLNEGVRVDEVEVGDPAEDEVRVRMAASGVCHSDYSIIDGTIDRGYPILLGHEGAAINTAKVRPGSSVAVFGSGGIGLNVIQGAAMCGANRIIAVDTNPLKLDFALRFGATHTIDASEEDVVARIHQMTEGRGADYTFEAIGNAAVMLQAYESTRRAGTVTVIGIARSDDTINLPARMLVRDEKRILGSYYGSARQRVDLPRMFDMYQSGHLKLDELVTKTY